MSGILDAVASAPVVWIMALFLGVAYWAFRPKRRSSRSQATQEDKK